MEVIYCSRCHVTDVPLMKYSKGKTGIKQYYCCRECNTKRMKKYFDTRVGKKTVKAALKRANTKFPSHLRARSKLNYAVRVGTVTKPGACSVCERTDKRIEGHHMDYSKPLDVQWLCSGCHADSERVYN